MRTIKRITFPLNTAKDSALRDLCAAYAREKKYWLSQLQNSRFQALLGSHRQIRDQMLKESYASRHGLQARHWKLALQDAVETWHKYWQALFVQLSPRIFKKFSDETQRHYAYFLIKGYKQFAALMRGEIPDAPFEVEGKLKKQTAGYVRRLVKRLKGASPTVRKARVVKFDSNCYDVFEHKERQYISLMSLEKGKRIVLPLEGKTPIEGNIALLIYEDTMEIHVSQDLQDKAQSTSIETAEAVDFGYTEVMTDTEGKRYGEGLGKVLTNRSDELNAKMKKRSKLHSIEKKHHSLKKARHLRKYNLGRKKFTQKQKRITETLKCEINQAIHQLIKIREPTLLITENLRHVFKYHKTKAMNRKLSSWLRGVIQNRVSFKALAEGFRHEQVNPAYGSQLCPLCGFVDQKNRIGDKFRCLYCRHEDASDRVAAKNYAKRFGDQEITLYTPYKEVKTILLDKFHRRLEAEQSATVPGRTLETVEGINPPFPMMMPNIIAGREQSRQNRTVPQRAKRNKHV